MDSDIKNDKIIRCVGCQQDFVWTIGEQEFYKKKRLRVPIRCPMCRATFDMAKRDEFRGKVKQIR